MEDVNENAVRQEWEQVSCGLERSPAQFWMPLLVALDARIDKRLVLTVGAIRENRHSSGGLLLRELGGYILNPAQERPRQSTGMLTLTTLACTLDNDLFVVYQSFV